MGLLLEQREGGSGACRLRLLHRTRPQQDLVHRVSVDTELVGGGDVLGLRDWRPEALLVAAQGREQGVPRQWQGGQLGVPGLPRQPHRLARVGRGGAPPACEQLGLHQRRQREQQL
jgi:hypothetical protein